MREWLKNFFGIAKSNIDHKHDWEPWDSGRGIVYCQFCNSRLSRAELSFQESQDEKLTTTIKINWTILLLTLLSMLIALVALLKK